jgi:hypothetical protein
MKVVCDASPLRLVLEFLQRAFQIGERPVNVGHLPSDLVRIETDERKRGNNPRPRRHVARAPDPAHPATAIPKLVGAGVACTAVLRAAVHPAETTTRRNPAGTRPSLVSYSRWVGSRTALPTSCVRGGRSWN